MASGNKMFSKALISWLICSGYFLALAFIITYVILPEPQQTLRIIISAVLAYIVTAVFLIHDPPRVFSDTKGQSIKDNIRTLPILVGVLLIFTVAFAVISWQL